MDLQHLRGSDGTGEAVLAHVDATRSIGSTVLVLDNVDNWNSKCIVVTGTPAANGYIAAAGMTIMYGHLDSGDFIIDGYAPGYSDNGNATTEIAIIKMCTSWADTLIDLLKNSLNDDGTLKDGIINDTALFTDELDPVLRASEIFTTGFTASGGVIAQSSGRIGTFSDIVYYIAGNRYTKTSIANKTYTATKDTWVFIDTAGTITYTEQTIDTVPPATPANSLLVACVRTDATNILWIMDYYRNATDHIASLRVLTNITTFLVSLPQTYDHIETIFGGVNSAAAATSRLRGRLNNDSSANIYRSYMWFNAGVTLTAEENDTLQTYLSWGEAAPNTSVTDRGVQTVRLTNYRSTAGQKGIHGNGLWFTSARVLCYGFHTGFWGTTNTPVTWITYHLSTGTLGVGSFMTFRGIR